MSNQKSSNNEEKGISQRIVSAMQGESGGIAVSRLAWQFAERIEQANSLLESCANKLGKGQSIDSYVEFNSNHDLLDDAEGLSPEAMNDWLRYCELFGWIAPGKLKKEMAQLLKEAFNDIESFKETLLAEYRKRLVNQSSGDAFPIMKLLGEKFSNDPSIQSEYARVTKGLIGEMEADLVMADGDPKSDASPIGILRKYRAFGLDLNDRKGIVEDSIIDERDFRAKELRSRIEELASKAEQLTSSSDWRATEQDYFAIDGEISKYQLHKAMPSDLSKALEAVRAKILHLRESNDSSILLQDALSALSDKETSSTQLERIEKIYAFTSKMGFELKDDVKKKVEAALSRPRKKEEPLKKTAVETPKKEKKPRTGKRVAPKPAAKKPGKVSASQKTKKPSGKKSKTPLFAGIGIAAAVAIGGIVLFSGGSGSNDDEVANSNNGTSAIQVTDEEAEKARLMAERIEKIKIAIQGLEALAQADYTADNEERFASQFASTRDLVEGVDGEESYLSEIEKLGDQFSDRKREYQSGLIAAAKQTLLEASEATDLAIAASSAEELEPLKEEAKRLIAEAAKAIAKTESLDSDISSSQVDELDRKIESVVSKFATVQSSLEELIAARNISDYFKPLERLNNLDSLSEVEKQSIDLLVNRKKEFSQGLLRLLSTSVAGNTLPQGMELMDINVPVELSAQEQDLIQRLVDNRAFTEVYVSKVRIFQGGSRPESEQTVYLAEPRASSQKKMNRRITYTYTARGFDEDGRPRFKLHEANFMHDSDGTGWGHMYEKSTLSPESVYYNESLNPAIKQLLQSPNSLGPIRIIADIAEQDELSPLFRAFWVQQLDQIMDISPEKWPRDLAPSLTDCRELLSAHAASGLPPNQWLASEQKNSPYADIVSFFDENTLSNATREIKAFALLIKRASEGRFVLAGHVAAEGEVKLHPESISAAAMWTINKYTGRLERMTSRTQPPIYAPIFTYQLEGTNARETIATVSRESGIDLSDSHYSRHLPSVLAQ